MRWIIILFGLLVITEASAQVVITANIPPYNFQVLPNSTRQINVGMTGGTLNTINWSILSETAGENATFTTPAGANVTTVTAGIPTVQVNFDGTLGNCTVSGSVGSYVISSATNVVVQAQSVDDTSKTAVFLFNVCAKTTTVIVAPAYQVSYSGQPHRVVQSWVTGDVDETGIWSITSQPGGGDGTLADTNKRDADFVATVTGRYVLTYTSNSNPTQFSTAIIYVSPNSLPAYLSTPEKTEPRDCSFDPALTGTLYDVGAGKAYATLGALPAPSSITAGSMIRIWNTDTTGTSPSRFNQYFQIADKGNATQPIIFCGVPDSLGNLPIIDGDNATAANSLISLSGAAGLGVVTTWPQLNGNPPGHGTPFNYWQGGSAGPSYINIYGLHIMHAGLGYSYTPPGSTPMSDPSVSPVSSFQIASNVLTLATTGNTLIAGQNAVVSGLSVGTYLNGAPIILSAGTNSTTLVGSLTSPFKHPDVSLTSDTGIATRTYFASSDCVNLRSGSYIEVSGNHLDTCDDGLFSSENANNAWSAITQVVVANGNHIEHSGANLYSSYHQTYFQTFYGLMEGNLFDNYTVGASGSSLKWRGVEGLFRYNHFDIGTFRIIDIVENQDAYQYVTFEGYFGLTSSCGSSAYCSGDTLGPNGLAGYQESAQKDFAYGNEADATGVTYPFHYGEDVINGMQDRNGIYYFYNNTVHNAAATFDTAGSAGAYNDPYLQQRIDFRNNILWGVSKTLFAFNRYATIITTATTNLMMAGSFDNTIPITGGTYSSGASRGWVNVCVVATCPWQLTVPLNTHQYGLTSGNYLTTSVQPYNIPSFIPIVGSPAINAGTALTGLPAQNPVRKQWVTATNSLSNRMEILTIGAQDSSGAPPPSTPSVQITNIKVTGSVKFQ